MKIDDRISESKALYDKAVTEFKPVATVVMLSGGDDSVTTLFLALQLGIKIDLIIHGNTGTGLPEATNYVREIAKTVNVPYAEMKAGDKYEKYVLRKGFFGTGRTAHSYAYHLLKATGFRSAISRNLRQRRRNFPVLCLNGVRVDESENRADNYGDSVTRRDPASPNDIWLNLIHWWTAGECLEFLEGLGIKRSPVAMCLGRSGECMCGTMQNQAARLRAAEFSPTWGKWLDQLEHEVVQRHPWRWGSNPPKGWNMERKGQGNLFSGFTPDFQPACVGCKSNLKISTNE